MTSQLRHTTDRGRHETDEERMDRLFGDVLQELRVLQTGAQLTAGFLLTLPFQQRFTTLDAFGRTLYLVLICLALLTTGLIMSAIAVHRRLTGRHIKDRVVAAGRRLLGAVLLTLGLLIVGICVLLFDMVVSRWAGLAAGLGAAVVLVGVLWLFPRTLLRDPDIVE
jgi:hypothetical protein